MKHQSPKTSRAIILALVLLAIAASPALASGAKPPKDTYAASYPATRLTRNDAEGGRLDRILEKRIPPRLGMSSGGHYAWYESARHPLMDSALPHVRFFMAQGGDWYESQDLSLLLSDSAFWYPTDLSRVLLQRRPATEYANRVWIAKVAIVVASFGRSPKMAFATAKEVEMDPAMQFQSNPDRTAGFPAIEFRSFKDTVAVTDMQRWLRHPGSSSPVWTHGILVDCCIGGLDRRLFVTFGPSWPSAVYSAGQDLARPMRKVVLLDGPEASRRGDAGERNDDVLCELGQLTVDGDTWRELDELSRTHVFLCAAINDSSTENVAVFSVSGLASRDTAVLYLRCPVNASYSIGCTLALSNGTAVCSLSVNAAQTAQWVVYVCGDSVGDVLTDSILFDAGGETGTQYLTLLTARSCGVC